MMSQIGTGDHHHSDVSRPSDSRLTVTVTVSHPKHPHDGCEEARRGDESGCVGGKLVGFGVLLGMADDALLEVEVSGSKRHGDDPKTVSTHARARALSLCPSLSLALHRSAIRMGRAITGWAEGDVCACVCSNSTRTLCGCRLLASRLSSRRFSLRRLLSLSLSLWCRCKSPGGWSRSGRSRSDSVKCVKRRYCALSCVGVSQPAMCLLRVCAPAVRASTLCVRARMRVRAFVCAVRARSSRRCARS